MTERVEDILKEMEDPSFAVRSGAAWVPRLRAALSTPSPHVGALEALERHLCRCVDPDHRPDESRNGCFKQHLPALRRQIEGMAAPKIPLTILHYAGMVLDDGEYNSTRLKSAVIVCEWIESLLLAAPTPGKEG